ncbi:hypothetical protein GCM10023215_33520 [Pseudonocardia yuanmonensis]|uniref:Regulator of SigK n=2 Tax=Pseudonocardia yuanmonensis TaxID=1095914 RepID=A0ABP8WPZ6_9PSEU
MSRQVAGFALHALEPAEEFEVRAHLARCPECSGALRRHDTVLAGLARTLPAVPPPAGLRNRILSAARAESPGAAPDRARRPDAPPPDRARTGWAATGPQRVWAAVAAAACVVAVGGLAGQAAGLHRQRDAEVAQVRDLGRLVTGMDAPGSTHATLTDGHGTPVAAVVAGPGARRVVVADLPTNDRAGSVYVLWGLDASGSAPVPLGTFDATSGHTDVTTLPAGGSFTAYAVSLEPGRTAPAVPSRVVASGSVV